MHQAITQPRIQYRPGTRADDRAAHAVLSAAFGELRRLNQPELPVPSPEQAAAELSDGWQRLQPLYEHLTGTAEQYWVAEHDKQVVGYARSTLRDGLRELTELGVAPALQAGGVGRELLSRAFPMAGARLRAVIAAPNPIAQVMYMRAGVFARFGIANFSREPEPVELPPDLELRPIHAAGDDILTELAVIDGAVLGFRRDPDHRYLIGQRKGMLVLRDGRPVGYGYLGDPGGPWALLDPADFDAALALAEHTAAREGYAFGLQVPLINRHAIDYLLRRGCRMQPRFAQFMADEQFGSFERYIFNNPMFFI